MDKLTLLLCWFMIQTVFANLCQKPCSCVDKTADCSNLGLKIQFNDTLWNNTDEISLVKLGGNEFKHIRAFPKLPIEYLSLYNNSIATIDDGAFKFLANLTTLDLSMNLLHSDELRPDIFKVGFVLLKVPILYIMLLLSLRPTHFIDFLLEQIFFHIIGQYSIHILLYIILLILMSDFGIVDILILLQLFNSVTYFPIEKLGKVMKGK